VSPAAESRIQNVLDELGIHVDPQLVELALTHRSWAFEHDAAPHNERLEFLGDSVLGLIVTEHLYRTYPHYAEGHLAKLRAAVVSTTALARRARELGLGSMIHLGRGEVLTGGADKDSILADTMEALIGAVYLSAGRDAGEAYVHRLVDRMVVAADAKGAGLEWKMSLQDLCAERGLPAATYVHEASGPDHDKRFEARACIDGVLYAPSIGRSKKEAEQGAAALAYEALSAPEGAVEDAAAASEG
jgi:ribonuclease-3